MCSNIEESLSMLPWTNTRKALNELQDLLKCSKCNDLPTSPQYMGRCEHMFCTGCISNLSDNFCPVCKIPSPPCDRKPDAIMCGLISSVSEMFTLINGGVVKINHGLEAPEPVTSGNFNKIEESVSIGEKVLLKAENKRPRNLGNSSHISENQENSSVNERILNNKGSCSDSLQKNITKETALVRGKTLPKAESKRSLRNSGKGNYISLDNENISVNKETSSVLQKKNNTIKDSVPAGENLVSKEENKKPSRNTGKTRLVSLDEDESVNKEAFSSKVKTSDSFKKNMPLKNTENVKSVTESFHKSNIKHYSTFPTTSKKMNENDLLSENESHKEGSFSHKKNQGIKKSNPNSPKPNIPSTPIINKRNVKGETPLHIACIKRETGKVKSLLEQGANPNTKDNAGWTPLHEACSHGFEDIAALLIEHGAFIDVPGNSNMTPLHDAVITGSVPVVSLLRKWGASDTVRDVYGRTARDLLSNLKSTEALKTALKIQKDEVLVPKEVGGIVQTKVILSDTNINQEYKKKLEKVSRVLKGKILNDFSNDVTHMIVGCEGEGNICSRTMKYMMAVVSGKWILSHKWLDECLSIGGFADPLNYEVEGTKCNPHCSAPRKGRLNSQKMLPGLFSGCHVYFHGSFGEAFPSKKELEALIKAGDGVILQREPNPESISDLEQTVPYYSTVDGPLSKCSHFIIYVEGLNEPLLKYDMSHIKSLPLSWLYNCIDQWCINLF